MVRTSLLTSLVLGLLAGCAMPSSQTRVYDRYAALVAERNRTADAPARRVPASSPKPADKPSPPAPPAPAQPAPVRVIAPPASTSSVSTPAPAKPAPAPVAVKATPAPAAPPAGVTPPPASIITPPAPEPAVQPEPGPALPRPAPDVPAAPATSTATSSASDAVAYLLKVGDVVQVFLRGIPSGEAIEDVIDEDGMISLPFINEIQAAGMTASELERFIRQTYLDQDIYRNITVNVVVPTRYYFIQGEIRGPGRFQMVSATRVSQAIAAAGGYTEYASGQVLIKRGGKIVKRIRNARRLERTPEDDILLEPDDIIEVKRSLW